MSGLFDFVKTVGKKLFGEGDDPAAKIKTMIEKDNPGLKDLGVSFKDGIVSLAGTGAADALQKAVLMAGNIMGVGKVKIEGKPASAVDDGTQIYRYRSSRETRSRPSPSNSTAIPTSIRPSSKPIAKSSRTPI